MDICFFITYQYIAVQLSIVELPYSGKNSNIQFVLNTDISTSGFPKMSFKVPQLKRFLQNRGVTCHVYRRDHPLRLCKLAEELKLEVLKDELGNVLEFNKSSTSCQDTSCVLWNASTSAINPYLPFSLELEEQP